MAFEDFDVEVQDIRDSSPEPSSGTVATTATTVTKTHTSGDTMFFFLEVPSKRDPDNPNGINDCIKYSLDGGTTYFNIMSGESVFLPANCADIRLKTNAGGTSYRIILWG